jgi:iron complex outermembrane receptor protein
MKRIILFLALIIPVFTFSQLSGRVVNDNNEGIPFASIIIKNTGAGTLTDSSGYFRLNGVTQFPFTIVVSYAGYKSQEKVIRNSEVNNIVLQLQLLYKTDTIVVTSRRRSERLQDVPIPISVISGARADDAGTYNVNLVKEYVPSVQLYSSNPRNTGINIRGIGSPFGLTNDGLDPGVGFYVDGVYYARPAAATLDFIDIERVEVLRGPQGTLFGKNTTAGAFSITTRKPGFKPGADFEVSYGNYGFVQAKSSITGPLGKKLAARLSFSGTQRDGVVKNIRTDEYINDINNLGFHAQLLYKPSEYTSIILSGDATRQRPNGYAQVIAGVVKTQRPAYRQFDAIISDLHYQLPTLNPFDRIVDQDTPWQSDNDLGGGSLNIEIKIGPGTLTSTTAWRYWNWDPSNDRDFTGLQALSKSQNPSKHRNWSQEFRYAGQISTRLSGVAGLFFIDQDLKTTGTEESGRDQWRFIQNSTDSNWRTPGLLDGYGAHTNSTIKSKSAAVFANIDWEALTGFHIIPGIRYNYDKKDVTYDRQVYGGLQTNDPDLIKLQQVAYSNQSFATGADETHFTYQLSFSYRPGKNINAFATFSTNFKPVGVNVGGLPVVNGKTATDLAVIKPEYVKDVEIGVKTRPANNFTLDLTLFNSDIKDYQANVQSPEIGVNRGYLANAEKVNVKGLELDASLLAGEHFSFTGSLAYTDARYVKFTNAPLPLEETGQTKDGQQVAFKDISGGELPGISKWAGSLSTEFTTPVAFLGKAGKFIIGIDGFARSSFSSSPSPSAYLNIDGYTLFNGRIGFRSNNGLSAFIWGHNLFDKNYFEQLLPAGGNAGQYAAVLGDPLTFGITLRYNL